MLSELNGAIRLLLTDVRMPELPCLFMTGYTDDEWALEALAMTCQVLRKPFTVEELELAVITAIGQQRH